MTRIKAAMVAVSVSTIGLALLLPGWASAQRSPNIIWQESANSDRVNTMNFTPDGTTLVSGSSDRLINFWNPTNGSLNLVLDSNAAAIHADSIECLAINPANPNQIATVSSNVERLWNVSAKTEVNLNPRPDNWMVWCAFSPNGQYLATASFNSSIRLWTISGDSATLTKTFKTNELQRTCAFSPDGKWLASSGGDAGVTVRDTSTWDVVAIMNGHTDDIYDMVFSPDGTMLATGSYDDTARLWNVGSWTAKAVLPGDGPVYGVTFTADSKTLAYTDGEGNHLIIADTGTGMLQQTFDVPDVQCVAYSPQGMLAYGDVDETVYMANIGTYSPPIITPSYTNGAFQLSISAPAGQTYYIMGSTDFVNWATLVITNPPVTPFLWTESGASNYFAQYFQIFLGL